MDRRTDAGHWSITIAHSEHIVLRWANNNDNYMFFILCCHIYLSWCLPLSCCRPVVKTENIGTGDVQISLYLLLLQCFQISSFNSCLSLANDTRARLNLFNSVPKALPCHSSDQTIISPLQKYRVYKVPDERKTWHTIWKRKHESYGNHYQQSLEDTASQLKI